MLKPETNLQTAWRVLGNPWGCFSTRPTLQELAGTLIASGAHVIGMVMDAMALGSVIGFLWFLPPTAKGDDRRNSPRKVTRR